MFSHQRIALGLLVLLSACGKTADVNPLNQEGTAETKSCTYVSGPNFSNHKACYQVKRGATSDVPIYQGDIKLARSVFAAEARRAMKESGRMATSLSNAYRDYFWPGAQIPYTVEGDGTGLPAAVADALSDLEARAKVDFIPRTNEADYIAFIAVESEDYCGLSFVGQVGGKQEIEINVAEGTSCLDRATIQHEAMHALGFWHEQSRPDRDDFIRILWSNVDPYFADQFDILPSESDGMGTYDFGSVMHYDRTAFSANGQDTIQADTEAHNALIGSATQASPLDVQAIQTIYGTAVKVDVAQEDDGSFSAKFTYKTSDSVLTKIRVGEDKSELEALDNGQVSTEHEIEILGFNPNKRYFYEVLVKTAGGDVWSQSRSFITDLTAPTIIDPRIHRISDDVVEVRFSTDEKTQGLVAFISDEEDADYEYVYDFSFGKIHNIKAVVGQGQYYVYPMAYDEAGNLTEGPELTIFNDSVAPTISNVSVTSVTTQSATIRWSTNEPRSSRVVFGSSPSALSSAATATGMSLVHEVSLTGLASNVTYYFKVQSQDATGNSATSAVKSFSTDLTAPVMSSAGSVNVKHDSADIVWETNEPSDSKVLYGVSCSSLSSSSVDSALVTSHRRSLTGLLSGTQYCYRVTSKDAQGNESTSGDLFFTTGVLESLFISSLGATVGTSSVTVQWSTNLPSDSTVEYGLSSGNYPYAATSSAPVSSHSLFLTQGLATGTFYYRVKSKTAAGTQAISSERSFSFATIDTISVSVRYDTTWYWLPRWVTATSSNAQAGATRLEMNIVSRYYGTVLATVPMTYQYYAGNYTAEIPAYLADDIANGWAYVRVTSSLGGSATW